MSSLSNFLGPGKTWATTQVVLELIILVELLKLLPPWEKPPAADAAGAD